MDSTNYITLSNSGNTITNNKRIHNIKATEGNIKISTPNKTWVNNISNPITTISPFQDPEAVVYSQIPSQSQIPIPYN